MKRIYTLLMIGALLSCQEEINEIVEHNNSNNGNGAGTNLPTEPVVGKYANCLSVLSNETLDVVTWNIEHFPKAGTTTIALMKEMILTMDADIIALQEIESTTNFNTLISELTGYQGVVAPGSGQRCAYIYKTAEITSFDPVVELFTDDNCAFPRAPLKATVTHVSGRVVTLLNVHLKCCDDGPTASCPSAIERRKSAITKIKNYIDTSLPNASVIVLGDHNEDLVGVESNGVFTSIIADNANYKYADMGIAVGSTSNFSYQSGGYISHLDHLLITNELFENLDEVRTLKLSTCESSYEANVTDHFPVMMRLKNLD
jgi:endonuclease/exonuclease/phosphatase family metal-dependent hydrolase